MDEQNEITEPDALWLAALTRDRARAAVRLADMLPGRDVGEAAALAARCVHAEMDREARLRAAYRARWIDELVTALVIERRKRPEHPGWAKYRRRARALVGQERITTWDAAAVYAVALRLPAVVWGERGGVRLEPKAVPHRLGVDDCDVTRWLPVSGPVQLWAERPATVDDPEPEAEIVDNAQPPDGVGVQE
jgi:hypothetical protein